MKREKDQNHCRFSKYSLYIDDLYEQKLISQKEHEKASRFYAYSRAEMLM
jgi:hypothetical protein